MVSISQDRREATKRKLIQALFDNLEHMASIESQDVEITLFENPRVNWGIRGVNGQDLALGYAVKV